MKTTLEQEEMKELIDILKIAERGGYKVYVHKEDNHGYILSDDSVLHIRKDYLGGWNLSFIHKPSKENSIDCRCYSNLLNVDIEIINKAFKIGNHLTIYLKVEKYKNSQEWFNQYWTKDNLVSISSNCYY